MKTLQEISIDLNIGLPTLHKRLLKYDIKGQRRSNTFYYTNEQNELLILYICCYGNKKNIRG